MAAYVVGLLIVLLLWGLGVDQLMGHVSKRFTLMATQALAYWGILLVVGYGLTVLLTEFVLPHSRLVTAWTQLQLQSVTQWSHGLGLLLLAMLLARVYLLLFPRQEVRVAPGGHASGEKHSAKAMAAAKARLKAQQKKRRA